MSGKVLCIYHGGGCTDGFAAAWAVWKALGDKVEFHAGKYGEAPPDVAGRHVLLVDFSYKRAVLDAMGSQALSVVVLDHHKTAFEDLQGYPVPMIPKAGDGPRPWAPVEVLFDMERSGAGIAWDYFHPDTERPSLIDLVELRDLWRNKDERWTLARLLHAYLNSFPFTFEQWDIHVSRFAGTAAPTMLAEGEAILRQQDKHIAELLPQVTRPMVIGGQVAPAANIPPMWSSDAAHLLLQRNLLAPFSATYHDGENWRYFSLRSADDRMDVGEVATGYGGGGHRNASGFRVPRDHELARM